MKHILITSLLALCATQTFAVEVPSSCKEGGNNHLKKLSGSDYMAIGKAVRFKADLDHTDPLESPFYRDVHFYTNEDGSVGKDNSGIEGNAYKNIIFSESTYYGVNTGKVWARVGGNVWSDDEYCAYKSVTVHNAPSVVLDYANNGTNGEPINAKATGYVDSISKLGREGGSIVYTWKFHNIDYAGTQIETIQTSSNTISYHPQYGGEHKVTVSINDGVFVTSDQGYALYQGSEGPGNPL